MYRCQQLAGNRGRLVRVAFCTCILMLFCNIVAMVTGVGLEQFVFVFQKKLGKTSTHHSSVR